MSSINGVALEEFIPVSEKNIQEDAQELEMFSLLQEKISNLTILDPSSDSGNHHARSSLISRVEPVSPINHDSLSKFLEELTEAKQTGNTHHAKQIIAYFQKHLLLPAPLSFQDDPEFELTVIRKLVYAAYSSPLIREFFQEFSMLQQEKRKTLEVIYNKFGENKYDSNTFRILLNEHTRDQYQLVIRTDEGYGLEEGDCFVAIILHELIHAYHWLKDEHSLIHMHTSPEYSGFDNHEEKCTIGVIQNVLKERFTENRFRLELKLPLRLGHRHIIKSSCPNTSDVAQQHALYRYSVETGYLGFPIDYDTVIQRLTLQQIQRSLTELALHLKEGSEEQQRCAQILLSKHLENQPITSLWKLLDLITAKESDPRLMHPIFEFLLSEIMIHSKNTMAIDNSEILISYNHAVGNAIKNNFTHIIPLLLSMKGNLFEEEVPEILINATTKGYEKIIEILLDKQTIPPTIIQAAIRTAAFKGRTAILNLLLNNVRLSKKELQNTLDTAIVTATEAGQTETLRMLLDITKISTQCRTNAIIAATRKSNNTLNKDAIEVLLESGTISLDATLEVLHYAIDNEHEHLLQKALNIEDNSKVQEIRGIALLTAAKKSALSCLQLLLKSGKIPLKYRELAVIESIKTNKNTLETLKILSQQTISQSAQKQAIDWVKRYRPDSQLLLERLSAMPTC